MRVLFRHWGRNYSQGLADGVNRLTAPAFTHVQIRDFPLNFQRACPAGFIYIYYTTVPDSVMRYAYPSEYIYIPAVYIMSRLATIKGDFLTRVKFMIFGLAEVASFNNVEECLWKEPISNEKPIPRTNIVIRFEANVRVAYAAGTSIEPLDHYL